MEPSLTDTLCTRCGLCCDGTLFADVELAGAAETTRIEILGLRVEDDADGLMLLPCSALKERRCSVYAHRPVCCRTFECKLLLDTRQGAVSVERAGEHIEDTLKAIDRVKRLLAKLGTGDAGLPLKERCAEALTRNTGATPEVRRRHAALEAAMAGVERRIRKTFLGRAD